MASGSISIRSWNIRRTYVKIKSRSNAQKRGIRLKLVKKEYVGRGRY